MVLGGFVVGLPGPYLPNSPLYIIIIHNRRRENKSTKPLQLKQPKKT